MTMHDYILRLPDPGQLEQRTALKKAMAGLFGDRHDGEQSRYLYSPEPRLPLGEWCRVRTMNGPAPESARPFLREIELPVPEPGQWVRATVWMAVKGKVLSRGGSHMANVMAALEAGRAHFSSAIEIDSFDIEDQFEVAMMERGREKFGRAFGRIEVTGQVRSGDEISDLLAKGVGAAKAYGFGLVDLQLEEDKTHG